MSTLWCRRFFELAAATRPLRPPPSLYRIQPPPLCLQKRYVLSGKPDSSRAPAGYMPRGSFRKAQARDLIYRLNREERVTLLKELQSQQQQQQADDSDATRLDPPTAAQLRAVGIHNALPFVGFGFLDNLIMIVAGDYIDSTIGAFLGISTLAAAGLGNLVSDVAGIGSAWYVESFVERIGVLPPPLSPEQLDMRSTRWSGHLGRAVGVSLGCLLGMFPLLFLKRREKGSDK